jgi:sec-independent protein translocase protein TatB
MASDFQSQFNEAMREAELDDIKKQVDDISNTASSVTDFDPLGDISKQFETAIEDKPAPSETPAGPVQETVEAEPPVATAPPAPELTAPAEPAPVAQDNTSGPSTPDEPDTVRAPQPKVGSGA